MPSPPLTRPSDARGRRSSAFVRERHAPIDPCSRTIAVRVGWLRPISPSHREARMAFTLKITFEDGRVEQSNFDSYLPMRIDEVPVVETHLIKNAEAPGGIGEAPTAIVSAAAAVTNAIFAATGKRLRSLPIDTDSLKSSS